MDRIYSILLDALIERLPYRPYCTDDPSSGLLIRGVETAMQHRHIQPNAPLELAWLIFDIDRPGAAYAWEWAVLPPPTLAVVNPINAHAHLFYGLKVPVALSDFARAAPIRYAAAIQAAYTAALRADSGYAGLIAKNPLHGDWKVLCNAVLYDLGELAEYATLPKHIPRRDTVGLGRNCALFDEVRAWAYAWVREYKLNMTNCEQWQAAVLGQAEKLNVFQFPLAIGEVRAIAKSVAKWTWRQFSEGEFSVIQSRRGRLGGRPRTTTKDGKPWQAAGISRATYYRRLSTALPTQ